MCLANFILLLTNQNQITTLSYNKIYLRMQTPKRQSYFKQMPATAETQKLEINRSYINRSSINKNRKQNYELINSFNKKLQFQDSVKTRVHTDFQTNKKDQQRNDRRKIIKYLDSKFSQYTDLKTCKQYKKQQIPKAQPTLSSKSKQNLCFLFKEYMSAIRLLKVQRINEYNLGSILKQMKFVKDLLNQRAAITNLWIQLQNPTVFKLFIFLAHLYLHLEYKQRGLVSHKAQYLNLMQVLFEEEGQKYSLLDLGELYESTEKVSFNHLYHGFLLNRQNRDTLSSFHRSISKNKL